MSKSTSGKSTGSGTVGGSGPTTPDAIKGFSTDGAGVLGSTHDGIGVEGQGGNGTGVVGKSNRADGVIGTSRSPDHAGVQAINDVGGYGILARSPGPNPAGYFQGAVDVEGDMHVSGTITVDTDVVLSNADCAEDFDLAFDVMAEPGTVVSVDASGGVMPAKTPYDRRVVGVVSGAGTYKPALILDRRPSARQRAPIALFGKVFCKVDADYGAIEVGDLLTTSSTPGHAMRVGDLGQAFGAVIGKALAPLTEGRGLIPILVSSR